MTRPVVVVLGGGFSGAVFVVHLLRAARAPVEILVVEPRAALGAGLAYGAAAPEHRINVPSDKMVVFAEDPMHLTRWVRAEGLFESDPEALTAQGHHYTRRSDFARYMAALLDESAGRAAPGATVSHLRATALDVEVHHDADGASPGAAGYRVQLDTGVALHGDAVVVSASHEMPAFPWPVDAAAAGHPGLLRDPWTQLPALAVEALGDQSRIVMAGTGLTMCDVVLSLRRRGFRGQVLAISRRALLPRVQGVFVEAFDLLAGQPVPQTARALLRLVRRAVQRAPDWRVALDATRAALPRLWQALAPAERRRALRRLRPFWDVHRFRMAPQVDAVLQQELARGSLQIANGRLEAIEAHAQGALAVRWHARNAGSRHTVCAAFINCTGPEGDPSKAVNPLLRSLLGRGLARVDPVGLGLDCDAEGRLRGPDGRFAEHLSVAGVLARAALAEVTGVPEASAHARRVAERLARDPAWSVRTTDAD